MLDIINGFVKQIGHRRRIVSLVLTTILAISVTGNDVFANEIESEKEASDNGLVLLYSTWKEGKFHSGGSDYTRTVRILNDGNYLLTYKCIADRDIYGPGGGVEDIYTTEEYGYTIIQEGAGTIEVHANGTDSIEISDEMLYEVLTAEDANLDLTIKEDESSFDIKENSNKEFMMVFKWIVDNEEPYIGMQYIEGGQFHYDFKEGTNNSVEIIGYIPAPKENVEKITLGDYSQEVNDNLWCSSQQEFISTERNGILIYEWTDLEGRVFSNWVEIIHDWYLLSKNNGYLKSKDDVQMSEFKVLGAIFGGVEPDEVIAMK